MTVTENLNIIDELDAGNEAALERIFIEYSPRLKGFARLFLGNDAEAVNDVVQESFINVWERRGSLKSISVKALLFTVVRNGCLNQLRRRVVENTYRRNAATRQREELYNIDFGATADTPCLYDELEQQINRVLSTVPEQQQEMFKLSRFYGITNKEIGARMNLSSSTVEKHVAKITARIRKHLARIYPQDVVLLAMLIICANKP